jgi:hypothetical protein
MPKCAVPAARRIRTSKVVVEVVQVILYHLQLVLLRKYNCRISFLYDLGRLSIDTTAYPIKLVAVIPNVLLFFSSVRTHALFSGKTDVNGVCGSSCEGIEGVDTIGVYEFDTKTGTVVATHLLAEGIGADPYTSPNGSK